jgi:predicted metalloprotease with PDZ domain
MRLILQPIAGGFELCARLGLVLAPATNLTRVFRFGMASQFEATAPLHDQEDGKLVHAVLDGSPSTRAGIQSRDIIFAINGTSWSKVRFLTFSDHHPSEITAVTFVGWQFAAMNVLIRVPPHPYRALADIQNEAADIVAARPTLDATPYRNPRNDPDPGMVRLLESLMSRRGRPRR